MNILNLSKLFIFILLISSCFSNKEFRRNNHGMITEKNSEKPQDKKEEQKFVIDTGNYNTNEYTVGPSDILTITLWKKTGSESMDVRVSEDGTISFLLIENQRVLNLTLGEIDKLLTEKLSKYYNEPRVDVIVKEYESQKATLLGAINTIPNQTKSGPGVYTLQRPSRVIELVTQAGGFKDSANLSDVVITRKDGKKIKLDLKGSLSKLESEKNIFILPGDVVFVPDKQETSMKIKVIGEVMAPGVYDIPMGSTILDAISLFGGFKEFGSPDKTRIIRKGKNDTPHDIPVNVKKILNGNYKLDVKLEDGDIIYVPQ